MKKIWLFLLLLLLPITMCAKASIYDAADHISPEGLAAVEQLGEGFSFADAARTMGSGSDASLLASLWRGLLRFISGKAAVSFRIPFSIAAAAVLCGLLGRLGGEGGAGEAGFFVSYALLAGLSATACMETASLCQRAAEDMTTFIHAALPALSVLSLSTGSGAAAITPLLLSASSAAALILTKIGMPALSLSLALALIGNLSASSPLPALSTAVRRAALWLVCGSMTLFSAFLSVSGYAAGSLGTVAAKGVKYAVSSLIPVLGSILSESAEAVHLSAGTIKSAAGGAGLIFLLLLVLAPILEAMLHAFAYRIAAAFAAPVADKRLCRAMGQMADLLQALAGMTAALAVLSMLSLGLLTKMGGAV